jgi:hypothetical protein
MSGLNLSGQASIARRLAGFSIIFVTATVIVASVILYLIVAGVVREQIDQRLDTQIEGLRNALTTDSAGDVVLSADLDGPPFDRPRSGWYWQVSDDRTRIASRSLAAEILESPPRPFDWRGPSHIRPIVSPSATRHCICARWKRWSEIGRWRSSHRRRNPP